MKKFFTYCILFAIILIGCILYLFRPNISSTVISHAIIAHAGGSIYGNTYTNSLEAVENAISHGVKYIELDLSVTSDGYLVCTHDWKTFASQAGRESIEVPSYSEFIDCRIHSVLTPMTMHLIDSVWTANPDLYLVTDKVSDFNIIDKNLGWLKDRLLIECFSYEDYVQFTKNGYYLPMLSIAPDNYMLLRQRIYKIFRDPDYVIPDIFVVNKNSLLHQYDGWNPLRWLEYTSYAPYSAHNRQTADSMFEANSQIRLIYVDDVE